MFETARRSGRKCFSGTVGVSSSSHLRKRWTGRRSSTVLTTPIDDSPRNLLRSSRLLDFINEVIRRTAVLVSLEWNKCEIKRRQREDLSLLSHEAIITAFTTRPTLPRQFRPAIAACDVNCQLASIHLTPNTGEQIDSAVPRAQSATVKNNFRYRRSLPHNELLMASKRRTLSCLSFIFPMVSLQDA